MVPRDFDNIKEGDILEINNEKVELTSKGSRKAVDLWNNKVRGHNYKLKVIQRRDNKIITEWIGDYPNGFYQSDTIHFPEDLCHLINFASANKETKQSNGPRMSADGCLINEDGTLVRSTGRLKFL